MDTDFTKYWNSDRTRKKQTALSRLSNGLLSEVINDPFTSQLFEPNELEAMRISSQALSKAKLKFAHIKEQKARIEKRKAQELAAINKQCKTFATKILDSLNSNPNTVTREQLCLWVTVARFTSSAIEPEAWELDINDRMDSHYLESDHAFRQRHAWTMREKAHQALERCLSKAWHFSFENDRWEVKVPIQTAVSDIKNLMNHDEYANVEKRYAHLIDALETFNREVEAKKRRKQIKPVD